MEIGLLVRVECQGQFRRGMIACINESDLHDNHHFPPTYDIIYKNNEEEQDVRIERIQPLLEIERLCEESQNHGDIDPQLFKLCGNNLFELKDYEGAYEYYHRAHQFMQQSQPLTVGKRVLVRVGSNSLVHYEIGMITEVQSEQNEVCTVDVMYDNYLTSDDNDEEIDVKKSRIINIYELENDNKLMGIELQRSVWMNLSKCATKRKFKGWAVYWALLAVGLVKGELSLFPEDKKGKYLSDAVFILTKGFIASSKPNLAKKASMELKSIETHYSLPSSSIRSHQLIKEIDSLKNQKLKENKILAKNIAEWVDKAMKEGENAVQFKNNDEDIDIMDDLQGDEIRPPRRAEGKDDGDGEVETKSSKDICKSSDEQEEKGECTLM